MLSERNELIPPSRVEVPSKASISPEHDAIFRRMVAQTVPDLPGPLPLDLFDPASARAAGALVACALARLHPTNPAGRGLVQAASEVPSPQTPAQHVTQTAILWNAIPVARRMQSEAFRALNREEATAESKEAAGELLTGMLARRPLLSFREDAEEFFAHSPPPSLEGFQECLGLQRWLIQRLASPCANETALARRAAVLRQFQENDLREILVLLEKSPQPPSPVLLAAFLPLLDRGQWPDDLAPSLRRHAQSLRKPPDEESHDRPEPIV